MAVVAAVSVIGYTVFATASTGPQNTSWTFKFKPAKKGKPTGTDSVIEPAKRDDKGTSDPDDDTYASTKKTVITFPAGSAFNTAVPPRCKKTASQVAQDRGASCRKAQIGGGVAESVFAQPGQPKTGQANASIKAYNTKRGIYFLIQPCQGGTKPCTPLGNPFVLVGTLKKAKSPTLTVPTPANLLALNIVITKFQLVTRNITKTRQVNGRRVVLAYVTTPPKCNGTWKSKATANYVDGSKLTINDTMTC
jgi:hypothetical protein